MQWHSGSGTLETMTTKKETCVVFVEYHTKDAVRHAKFLETTAPSVSLRHFSANICAYSRDFHSLGRMQPYISYALSFAMDRDSNVEAAMPYGPKNLG